MTNVSVKSRISWTRKILGMFWALSQNGHTDGFGQPQIIIYHPIPFSSLTCSFVNLYFPMAHSMLMLCLATS